MDTIIEIVQGNIKIVQYNKPKRKNAIDKDMYIRVTKILKEAAGDPHIDVMVLTGTGDYYSSGNDLVAVTQQPTGLNLEVLKEYIDAFITFPKILVAVVNGPAVGIAATTLALCDLVFAAEHSFFWTPFTKLGIIAEGCSTYTFPKIIGPRKATEMLIMNHKMSAKEALQYGFVNYVYKQDEIQTKVWDKITEVSKLSPYCVQVTKSLIRRTMQDELLKTNEKEIEALENVWKFGITDRADKYTKKSKI